MDSKGPSSSTSSSRKWKYDVFLSFRGEDTRKSFTDHLYTTLKQKGIFTFRDDEKLERGKPIKPKLLEAIEESLYAIVILSKNYASSTWCLDELVKIMECKNKIGLIVYPIFYDVDPSEVRKQTGTYAQAFVKHERENIDKVHIWRAALTEVANLSGLSLHDRYESEFIRDIVEFISYKLRYPLLRDIKGLVGIDSQVEDLMSLLSIGSNDVRIIGIWGMGGIGKTTLARVVYDMIFSEFEGDCFITNVRSKSEKYGLLPLQQKLISDILMEKSVDIYIRDDYDGVRIIKNSLSHKKILLVLDDVNHFSQLEKLAGESDWFGPGSRVIITTREGRLLKMHNVCGIYEPQGLNDMEALRLFSLKAFKIDNPPEDYLKLSTYFVNYAKGLPLAIDVLGSFLHGRSKEEWESASYKLKEYPEKEINETLEISFNGLQDIEKEIFLHIACFFNMKDKDYIVEILDCLGLYPTFGLDVLIEKSLLKDYENKYWMHDLLQIMGQDIVRRDYPQEPEKWSKLWLHKDIRNLLMKNTEMEAIEGLVLECGELHKSEMAYWNLEAFPNMPNLKLLIIHDVQLLHGPKHLSNKLRILDWSMYPSKSLPSNFQPYELVELQLLHSKIEQLWKGTKYLDKLRFIKLNNSLKLIATPDFTGVPNLEKLVFNGCINLLEVHPSIMVLKRLTLLDLENCKSLRSLPSKFEMESLEILILSGFSKIEKIPEFMGSMKRLSKLHLNGTAITKLPSSIEHLTNLEELSFRGCIGPPSKLWNKLFPFNLMQRRSQNLVSLLLPSLLGMCSLKRLDLSDCSLQTIPNDFGNLSSIAVLNLSENHFSCLPKSIRQLSKLSAIYLRNCTRLCSLPQLPSTTFWVVADGCTSLETFPNGLKPHHTHCTHLFFLNCFKMAGRSDMFINVLRMLLTVHQEICKHSIILYPFGSFNIVIPGSEIPKWFSHQSVGNRVNEQVTHPNKNVNIQVPSRSSNMWIGIAVCAVLSCPNFYLSDILRCCILINKHKGSNFSVGINPRWVKIKSHHLWLSYIPSQMFNEKVRAVLSQIDENGIIQIEVRFQWDSNYFPEVNKCGFRMVYEQDIEDIREMISAQSSNSTCITPYEGLNIHHDFHNSTEGIKMKRSRDEYEGAGASGEGNSNDVSHSKRIER